MDSLHPRSPSSSTHTTGPFPWEIAQKTASPFEEPSAEIERLAIETWGSLPFERSAQSPSKRRDPYRGPLLEVMITWGNSVLHLAHIRPMDGLVLGETQDENMKADVDLAAELLGRSQLPLIEYEGSTVYAVIPEGIDGTVTQGRSKISLRELCQNAENCTNVPRAKRQRLGRDMRVNMELPGVSVSLGLVEQSKRLPSGLFSGFDARVPLAFGACLSAFAAVMASLAFFVPPIGLADEEELAGKRFLAISHYMDALSEKEEARKQTQTEDPGSDGGAEAKKAEGEEGEAGKESAPRVQKQAAVAGPRDNQTLELSKKAALHEATTWGMVGLLKSSVAGDPNAPTSMFGGDLTLGNNDLSANGNMWGDEIGESGGMGGLGLSGAGFGGGALLGNGLGIGTGTVGTIGAGTGQGGMGLGHGRPGGTHQTRTPRMITNPPTTSGRLPATVIQRVVRQNFGRFRMCYEQGLGRNPNLEGRVEVRFIIGSDGTVSTVSGGGDMPDAGVKTCVANAFYGISFPSPEAGTVKVSYPLMFQPE